MWSVIGVVILKTEPLPTQLLNSTEEDEAECLISGKLSGTDRTSNFILGLELCKLVPHSFF